jgi:hypothetical protein
MFERGDEYRHPGRVTHDRDHALARVRRAAERGEAAGDPAPPHGEHLIETFEERTRSVGMGRFELLRERDNRSPARGDVRVRERGREFAIYPGLLIFREIPGDVATLMDLMPISA